MNATSFIMPDQKKKSRVVVGGDSSCRAEGSGAAPVVGVYLNDHCHPDPPIGREAVVGEETSRRVEDEGAEADDQSEIISVGGPF